MGVGSRPLHSEADYIDAYRPGHFWSTLLDGDHVSSDAVVIDGEPKWWRHAHGITGAQGTFDYWEIGAAPHPAIEEWVGQWSRKHLKGYSGIINLETIGARIIEVHLRFADQWPDLYGGDRWVEALVRLYQKREWTFNDRARRTGYSVVLFSPHGRRYRYPSQALQQEILALPGVSSLQITFHEDWAPERHAMPPGGFRVAIINCWDRAAGNAARDRLRAHFEGD
jgi:hypothetical protein